MGTFRDKLKGSGGLVLAGLLVVGTGALLYYEMSGNDAATAGAMSRRRTFIDAETAKPFEVTLESGMTTPVKSPDTGKMTGVEAELCYWTAEGNPKATPDPVLLNAKHMSPLPGATFCPVCHRLVVARNPMALPGEAPPPTEAEYRAGDHGSPSRSGDR